MNYNKYLTALAILIVASVGIIYARSFTDDLPSCKGYVTNVYLYVILGLLITAFTMIFMAKRRYAITTTKSLMAFCVALISLFLLYLVKPEQVLVNHLIWLTFILAFAVTMFVPWRYTEYGDAMVTSMIITIILMVVLTSVATMRPDLINLGWGTGLTTALAVGLLAWVIPLLFAPVSDMRNYYRVLSAIFVVIFMLFVLYDTKLLRAKAAVCTVPDYPKDSLSLFLDAINLYGSIDNLYSS